MDAFRLANIFIHDLLAIYRSAGGRVLSAYLVAVTRTVPTIIQDRTLEPADAALPKRCYRFRCTPNGRTVVLDTAGGPDDWRIFSAAREMYCRQVYCYESGFEVMPGYNVLDLGANIGLFSTQAAISGAQVMAVEAQSELLPMIYDNLARNAVMDHVKVQLALVGGNSGVLSTNPEAASHWKVDPPHMTLARVIAESGFEYVDLLKMDIEGSEFAAFDGDISWLSLIRRVVMEVHTSFGDPQVIRDLLVEEGFVVTLFNNNGRRIQRVTEESGYLFAGRVR